MQDEQLTDEQIDELERLERELPAAPLAAYLPTATHLRSFDAIRTALPALIAQARRGRAPREPGGLAKVLHDARRLMKPRRGDYCSTECLGQCEDCQLIARVDAALAGDAPAGEASYVCTHCGWSGPASELRAVSASIGRKGCARCSYMVQEVRPAPTPEVPRG